MLPIYQSVHQSIDSIEIELTQLSIVAFYLKLRKPLLLITTVCMEKKEKEKKKKRQKGVAVHTRCFSSAFRISVEANPLDSRNLVSFVWSFEPKLRDS